MPSLRRFFCCGPCGSIDVEKLTPKEQKLQDVVDRVKRRGEADEAEREWLDQVETILADSKRLKNEINENKDCCKRTQLSDRLEKMIAETDRKLQESEKLKGAAEQLDLPEYLIPSESSKIALDQIMEALIDEDVSVVGLFGIGGVGKTTVAIQLTRKVKESFPFNKIVMVEAKTEDPGSFRTRIAASLGLNFKENEDEKTRLKEEIQGVDKILIILDDVWKEPDLEAIGIPFGKAHKGCKILLTTRLLSVCTSNMCQRTIQLHSLSTTEQWELFTRCSELNSYASILRTVVEACDGLPLPIVTTWKKLKANPPLSEEDLRECSYKDIYKKLLPSYDHFKDKATRFFFLLCSHFPKGYIISTEDLMRMAFGLGLFDNDENVKCIEDARKKTREAISNLRSSLLLAQDEGEGVSMVAEIFRGLAHWIASVAEANLTDPEKEEIKELFNSCKPKAISILRNISDGNHLDCSELETLVIFAEPQDLTNYYNSLFTNMTKLKVLSLVGGSSWSLPNPPSVRIEGLQLPNNLRVLRFQRYKITGIRKLKELNELKILAFVDCDVDQLPEELGDLNSTLRLLDLSRCQMPPAITQNLLLRLSNLEELYIGFNRYSSFVLRELNSLDKLTVLSLEVPPEGCPDGFVLPRLERDGITRYEIAINMRDKGFDPKVSTSKALRVKEFPLKPFTELFRDVEHLYLHTIEECPNLIPSLDVDGLKGLKYLEVDNCSSMNCLLDIGELKKAKGDASLNDTLSNVTTIKLVKLPLSCLWKGKWNVKIDNLKVMKIEGCNGLTDYLLSPSIAEGLKQLEVLDIKSCSGLKRIIGESEESTEESSSSTVSFPSSGPVSLPELKSVKIDDCTGLESIFPSTMAEGLPLLRDLEITGCSELKHVFTNHYIPYVEAFKLELPSLQRLVLKELKGMKRICFSTEFIVAPLEELEVEGCPLLETFALPLEREMHARMKKLHLGKIGSGIKNGDKDVLTRLEEWSPDLQRFIVGNEEVVFGHQCGFFFSRLKELKLSDATQFKSIWKECNRITDLQNLSSLDLVGCENLKYIFTLTLAINLPWLKNLSIDTCNGLGRIIQEDNISRASDDEQQPAYFPNLTGIKITNCNQLKSVFPVKVARFQKLRKFHVENAPQLSQIFVPEVERDTKSVSEGERDTKPKKKVELPQLQELTLINLSEHSEVIPAGYHFVFSSLRKMTISDCPNMKTSFTFDSKGNVVHAETEGSGNSQQITASSNTIPRLEFENGGNLIWPQDNTQRQQVMW